MLLLGSIVLALPRHLHPECVPVEAQARFRVADYDGRMVDPEEEPAGRSMPFGLPLAGGKRQNFQMMPVRISEIESFDPGRVLVPIGQALRPCRGVRHLVGPQAGVCFGHIADDDCDMLKPPVIAGHVHRDRPAFRRQVFRELDLLISELHPHDSHPRPEHALEPLVGFPPDFDVRDGHSDRFHRLDHSRRGLVARDRCEG